MKRIPKFSPYWGTLTVVARKAHVTRERFYNRYIEGSLLMVFPMNPKNSLGITWTEFNLLYPDIQKPTARRRMPEELFIGYTFRKLAKKCGAACFRSLNDILRYDKWFDGDIYLSEQAFYHTKEKTFRFVCARIYEYNEIVKRHRPGQRFRHLILCTDTKRKFALKLKKKMARLYPGVIQISSITQVTKVKEVLCAKTPKKLEPSSNGLKTKP